MKKLFVLFAVCLLLVSCTGVTTGTNAVGSSTGVTYQSSTICQGLAPNAQDIFTGIRGVSGSSNVYISGILNESANVAYLYTGSLTATGSGGSCESFVYPGALSTSFYGPDNGNSGYPRAVGSYSTESNQGGSYGLLFIESAESNVWMTLVPSTLESQTIIDTIAHSVMESLVVGNYMTNNSIGKAFIYDIGTQSYYHLHYPGAISITAYGVWYNGGESYTIAGGYSIADESGLGVAYLVDWNSRTHQASNWESYTYQTGESGIVSRTHFEGITSDGNGGYNLAADAIVRSINESSENVAMFVNISRNSDGSFGPATWVPVNYPSADNTSANSVYTNNIIGVYSLPESSFMYPFIATAPGY